MPVARASHSSIEVLGSRSGGSRVSHHAVETLGGRISPTNIHTGSTIALGAYGDECNTGTLDAAWTLRNIASVSGDGSKYSITLDAQGDAMTRAITDPQIITAVEEYSASYAAWKALDGDSSTGWAATGYSVGDWWKIEWTAAQTLSSVILLTRPGNETFGYGHLEFSSGANVSFTALSSGVPLTVTFSSRSTTFVKIVSEGGGSGNAGLQEVTFPDGITASLNIVAHFTGLTDIAGMIAVTALDASNNGVGASSYSDRFCCWTISSYNYSGDAGTSVTPKALAPEHWVHLRRKGVLWQGRYSLDGLIWSFWSAGFGYANGGINVTKIGIGRLYSSGASQTLGLERFVWSSTDMNWADFTGGLVSQDAIEVLAAPASVVRVSQDAIEILEGYPPGATGTSGSGGVRVYGHAT